MTDQPPVSSLDRVNLTSCWIAAVVSARDLTGGTGVRPVPALEYFNANLLRAGLTSSGTVAGNMRVVRGQLREHYRTGAPTRIVLLLNASAVIELMLEDGYVARARLRLPKQQGGAKLYDWS